MTKPLTVFWPKDAISHGTVFGWINSNSVVVAGVSNTVCYPFATLGNCQSQKVKHISAQDHLATKQHLGRAASENKVLLKLAGSDLLVIGTCVASRLSLIPQITFLDGIVK